MATDSTSLPEPVSRDQRTVVLHYHLFKNAGTSIDTLLRRHFRGSWVTREFPSARGANHAGVRAWIETSLSTRCFSSHTAMLPPPRIAGITVVPILFVRHPLDRIASVYAFERHQQTSGFGASLAKRTDLKGYIEARMAVPGDRQCRNFHARRLSQMFGADDGDELNAALRALDNLPFVGLVEQMDRSLHRLGLLLEKHGLGVLTTPPEHRNASAGRAKRLDDRLLDLANEIGDEAFQALSKANEIDLAIYENVAQRYA